MYWKSISTMSGSKLRLSVLTFILFVICGAAIAQQPVVTNSMQTNSSAKPCVLVSGAVVSPTRLELNRPVRLSEAIELAGGFHSSASADVEVVHGQRLSCYQETRELAPACLDCLPPSGPFHEIHSFKRSTLVGENDNTNPYLRNGDIVVVADLPKVYIAGNVAQPQALVFKPGMTLTSVLKITGGVLRNSITKQIRIYRGLPNKIERLQILVDLEKIRKHPELDIVLEPFDVVDVPRKGEHPIGAHWGSVSIWYPVRRVT